MSRSDPEAAGKTYHAIGRFIFEFSQAEYTIRHYLAEEIRLDEAYFSAVIETYDVGLLCSVAKEVFDKTRANENAQKIKDLINKFHELNVIRNRVAHGLWVPFKDGGMVHHVPRNNPKSRMGANQAAALEKFADDARSLRADLEHAFLSFEMRGALDGT
ncbi:MAG TPA: hypothetical protein VIE66_18325 [Methylocella sp.]|jgi:hypothetical protein